MTIDQLKRIVGYQGCRNCAHQVDVLRGCEWLERGGDGVVHLMCPRWDKRKPDGERGEEE